jgi:ElaB/YqjD/DUF883 family membrane-anchored ribosome-binding protein
VEALIEFITQNPLYGVGLVALVLLLLFALIKKMVKLIIIAVLLNLGYGYYLQDMAEDAYARAEAKYKSARDQAENLIDEAGSLIKR